MDAFAVELLEKRSIKFYLSVELRMSRFDVDGSDHLDLYLLTNTTVRYHNHHDGGRHRGCGRCGYRLPQSSPRCLHGGGFRVDARRHPRHHRSHRRLPTPTRRDLPPHPEKLAARKAIVNVCNYTDNKCFMWSVLAALHPVDRNTSRISNYVDFESELNMAGIAMPVALKDVDRFETQNAVSVNVFGYEGVVYPLRITELRDRLFEQMYVYVPKSI